MWRSPVARLLWEQEVPGSNPGAPMADNPKPRQPLWSAGFRAARFEAQASVSEIVTGRRLLIREAIKDLREVAVVESYLPDLLTYLQEFIRSHYLVSEGGEWIP